MVNIYSDNIKSAICGGIFTLSVIGFLCHRSYMGAKKTEIYQKIDRSISGLDHRPETTSLTDWNIAYQRGIGRELKLGEHPLESNLEDLVKIETNLANILSTNWMK